jgi:group I intron endonuclease
MGCPRYNNSTGIIYIATHIESGKQYVGQTVDFCKRIWTHLRNRQNTYFGNALQKYGRAAFHFQQIIYKKEDLNYWEQYFVSKLNTLHPHGYNLKSGGNVCEFSKATIEKMRKSQTGKRLSEETKMRISKNGVGMLGKKHTEAAKMKMSNAVGRGEKNHNFGKHLSIEHRRRISESRRGIVFSEEHRQKMSEAAKRRWANA